MAGKVRISFAASALTDLDEILEYYAGQEATEVGKRLVAEIITQVEALAHYPDLGRVVPEFGVKNLKELIRPPFRIVYRRDKSRVRVVRIWRSERLLKLPS